MNLEKSKIYYDGSHYIAIPPDAFPHGKGCKRVPERKPQTEKQKRFDAAYKSNRSKPKKERDTAILEELRESFDSKDELSAFVNANMERVKTNRIKRIVRLMRKLRLQDWNYFCTFTYDSKLHTEESFRKTLANTLKHLVYRNGWKYVGVWERSPEKQRLHFHGIFYIPKMVGTFEKIEDYSTKNHCRQTTLCNSHFLKHFGRNDFRPISEQDDITHAGNYIIKYLEKTGERLVYGGKLPTYFVSDLLESDILCMTGIDDRKAVLSDTFACIKDGEYIGPVSRETIEQMPKCN